jgi:YD repeat-containing protein
MINGCDRQAHDADETGIVNENGTAVTKGYDEADRLGSVLNKSSSGTTLSSFTYAYNADSLRSTVTEADGSVVTYGYDGVHWQRLSKEPLLPNGLPGTWNSSESGHPGVFVDDDGTTWLFYQGNPDNGHTWHLAVARIGWHAGRPGVLAPQSDSQV